MNNPRKRAPRVYMIEEPEVPAPKPAPSAENRRQSLLIRIGVLVPLVLLVITLARGAGEKKAIPDYLQGVWQSSDAHYADCSMEITPATVQFGNAQRGYLLYFVSSVELVPDAGQTSYIIHYTDLDGLKYQMSLRYNARPQPTLNFRNQPGVQWTRRPST
jgi:hypothetical protein